MARAAEIGWDAEQVMAASMDAMALIDGEQYVSVNQPYADIYGFPRPDDLAGESWRRRLPEEEQLRFERDILPTCREEGVWRGSITGRKRDGATFSQELSIAGLDGEHFICTSRESDRGAAIEREVESHGRLVEHVFDAVDDIVYVLDEDGDAVLWNETLREVTGYTDEEIAAMDPKDLIAPEQHEYVPGLAEAIDQLDDQHVDLDLVTRDGDRIPHAFRGTTFEDPETGRIYRCGIARDVRERRERERELERYETIVETVDDGVYALDEGLRFSFVNESFCEMTEVPREDLLGMPVTELFEYDDEVAAAEEIRQHVLESDTSIGTVQGTLTTSEGERVLEARYRLHPDPDGEYRGSIGVVRDVTEREERERKLERHRDELSTLDRINELLFTITRDLFESPTREEIEQMVCDRLDASDLYQFAWIGEPDPDGDRIVPRASAGIDDGYVDAITVTTGETDTGQGPGGRALRTGTVQVSQDVRSDPTFEPWREEALDRGIRSAAAIPLAHGDATYGLLAVYATRPLAFSRREQAGLETLGKAVGFAINAIENRKLLFADTVVELEFEVTDSALVFVRLSERLGCELEITGYVESASAGWSVYVTVEDAAPTDVRDVATEDPDVERVRVVADESDEGLLEFVMTGPALNELTEHGAILTSGTVDDGQGRFCIEAPRTTDVRQLSARLQRAYPESMLVAQREFDRPVQTVAEMRESLEDRLTDRQREALTRAYHAGYFDWPHRSTAGDIAESMDIAETTFHYHLRSALDKLLSVVSDVEGR